jgi:lipoprotein-anchoring transpeptidase ErfK/SrfK
MKVIDRHILVDISRQTLDLREGERLIRRYAISTARAGPGERRDSGCTPRGLHRIRLRIGQGCSEGTVFVGRRTTGEVYGPELAERYPDRDGRNRGGDVDTLRRYIYIHGCPDSQPMGEPCSHGCIRMRNPDLMELFDLVVAGTPVDIR